MKENNLFYTRLRELIKASGVSANQVEKDLGYSRNTLQNYKNGQEPSATRLLELSEYFAVSPEFLIGKTSSSQIAPLETIFERLDFDQKRELTKICQAWLLSTLNA